MDLRKTFEEIAERASWSHAGGSLSGPGSDQEASIALTPIIKRIFERLHIKKVLDLGCGTGVLAHLLESIGFTGTYVGVDIAKSAIPPGSDFTFPSRFIVGDILEDGLPDADLVVVKDVLQHLPNDSVSTLLENLERYPHVIFINDIKGAILNEMLNQDIPFGAYRPLDLNAAPFHLAAEVVAIYRTPSSHARPDLKQVLIKGAEQSKFKKLHPLDARKSVMIKKIHQTWKTANKIPDCYLPEWRVSWKTLHPGWEYQLWTDEDNERLVREHYPQFARSYVRIEQGIVKSDVARALILHHVGGIYADLDFVCLKSFEPLLSAVGNFMVFGFHDQPLQPYPNALMYSPPGHPFWLNFVRDSLEAWEWGERKVEVIAGPDRLCSALDKYDPQCVILPSKLWYSNPWGHGLAWETAHSLAWDDLDELREAYPEAMAVTSWAHNW